MIIRQLTVSAVILRTFISTPNTTVLEINDVLFYRLVQHPNSYFMDVKCPGCYKITTVFSHAQSVVVCVGCNTVLCQPLGGKAKLTEGTFALLTGNFASSFVRFPALSCFAHL